MNINKCPASTEIINAILFPQLNNAEMLDFLVAPTVFMRSHCNVEIPKNFNIKIVVNTIDEVSLALPYYSNLETLQSEMLADENLATITGGEVLTQTSTAMQDSKNDADEILSFASLGRSITRNLPTVLIECRHVREKFNDL